MLKSLFKATDETAVRPAKLVDDAGDEFSPVAWTHCFDQEMDVAAPESGGTFHAYVSGDLDAVRAAGANGTAVLLLHGAGQSSLVWAHFAAALRSRGLTLVAYDARGHGGSRHDDEVDMSADRLAADCVVVAQALLLRHGCKVVLVGHSMGGATAIHAAKALPAGACAALVVMDVVEGTALASLPHILSMVNARPAEFATPHQAVRWALDSNTLLAVGSARISVPGQLVRNASGAYVWRTDLTRMHTHWSGWYQNMSALFLAVPLPKLLVLAGTERLDTPLTIGQMQGRYQLEVFPQCGHQLHEDEPELIALKVALFLKRFLRMAVTVDATLSNK